MTAWTSTADSLAQVLRDAGLRRACFGTDRASGEHFASHPCIEPVLAAATADPAFDRHAACFFELGEESGHLMAAFIHRTERGQAAGGVRFWSYPTLGALVRDGLRLSRAMGQKNALAGLWWGGGKGIIARRDNVDYADADRRAAVFRDYGRFVSGLSGCYVTAEDVGTRPHDMAAIFSTTRHTTCIPPALGGSGNPSILTARGVVVAMEATLAHGGNESLAGKFVAMQGAGNVAVHMIGELLERDVRAIVASDIDPQAIEAARQRFAGSPVEFVERPRGDNSVLATECDILAPNAIGGILNPDTIPGIRAPIVCGAANNQLADLERDASALQERGILFVPDFLANRMGIVNCANEQYGVVPHDPAIEAHLDRDNPDGVYRRLLEVLKRAERSGRPPALEATSLADELAKQHHPIWGNRGQAIIDSLIAQGWATGP